MVTPRPWSDLHSELLVSIANADSVSLRDYACLRRVCTAWRSALKPPYPCLLSLQSNDDKGWHCRSARPRASVFSLPMRRSSHLQTLSSTLEVRRDHDRRQTPVSEVRASLLSLPLPMGHLFDQQTLSSTLEDGHDHGRRKALVSAPDVHSRARVVGSSNGRFAIAVDHAPGVHHKRGAFLNCWTRRIFLLDPRAGKEVELAAPTGTLNSESGSGPCHEYVHKVVFPPGPDDEGTVVALYDRKCIAYMDAATSRDRDKWRTIDDVGASNTEYIADVAFGDDGQLYCLDGNGCVHVIRIPGGAGGRRNESAAVVEPSSTLLNDHADYLLNPAAAFATPYDIASARYDTKHLFFCHGSLYQVWRNRSVTVTSSGGFRMPADEILVVRYDPERWPCWDAVKDLGGCSVFVDKNSSPAVVRAAGVPGVRANCVYWIDSMRVPMVCDIATGTSKPYVLPHGTRKGNCWYFGQDDMTGINGDGRN